VTAQTHARGIVVSVTRLHLRALRFLPAFAIQAARAQRQARDTDGCLGVKVRKSRGLAFWTLTLWRDEACLRRFMSWQPHRSAMRDLANWCDEAAVVRWESGAPTSPGWDEAALRLGKYGRLSALKHPSADHLAGRINTT